MDVQFGDLNIKDVDFNGDYVLTLIWESVEHSVRTQIDGLKCKKTKADPTQGGSEVSTQPPRVDPTQQYTIDNNTIDNNTTKYKTPLSKRKRVGEYKAREYKNFMEMKEHLASNHNKYKNIPIEFEGVTWKIGKGGIPWNTKEVDDMPFEQRKLFWLHLINYQHLLKG